MVSSSPKILIAGAGLTGMGGALGLAKRDLDAHWIESRPEPGGLARTVHRQGLHLNFGVHLLHPSSNQAIGLVQEMIGLMGDQVRDVLPTSKINFLDTDLAYPFRLRELMSALGVGGMSQIVGSTFAAKLHRNGASAEGEKSFETIVQGAFGKRFYGLFFRDYTRKVLGIDPAKVSGDWAIRRVPLPTASHFLQTFFPFWKPSTVKHAHSPFPRRQFTGAEGMYPLFEGVFQAVKRTTSLELGTSLEEVLVRKNAVAGFVLRDADGKTREVEGKGLLSTIPLTELIKKIRPAPPEDILRLGNLIRYRGLIFVLVMVKRQHLLPAHWVYYHGQNLVFNRLSEHSAMIPDSYGADRTIICAEITSDPHEELWGLSDDMIAQKTVEGLKTVFKSLRSEEILASFVEREQYGYPLWDMGYRRPKDQLISWLEGISGLVTAGRQGRFDYLNMDESFASGLAGAERV